MSQTIELKLLKIINTLVLCGSVKTTAKLLNLSPAAISYSLKKLRDITGEHLFIRTRTGMKANATANELSQRYQKYFATDADIIRHENKPNENSLTILSYSPIEMLLSESIANLAHQSNRYRYIFLPYTIDINERLDNLANRNAYLDIGAELPQEKAISKIKLFSSNVSILAGVHNTDIQAEVSCDDLYQAQHAIWSSLGDYYCENMQISGEVKKYIHERNVAVVSGSIINMVELCARSKYIMLLPDIFIPLFTQIFAVKRLELPAELRMKHDCYIHFNNRMTENPIMTRLIDDIIHSVSTTFTCQSP
ncbi:LysR family transcriptional regulator [Scandinavium goeteborgense]|uniref:DNA-binding transcriptional LysR family regulator n=1 Tax=Scandinavium goeteborgense TaxID=1851514 RepID=A0A4V3BLN7_SCAGO|nr:LysR family transcriptional regulator [Scandinavium goeteborgense]TDN47022.1 DNA-binding transcriptional LysR family regulator [Scandinavium goeteborgense]